MASPQANVLNVHWKFISINTITRKDYLELLIFIRRRIFWGSAGYRGNSDGNEIMWKQHKNKVCTVNKHVSQKRGWQWNSNIFNFSHSKTEKNSLEGVGNNNIPVSTNPFDKLLLMEGQKGSSGLQQIRIFLLLLHVVNQRKGVSKRDFAVLATRISRRKCQ